VTASYTSFMQLLLASGGPREWPANVPWPLHQTVVEFLDQIVESRTLQFSNEVEVVPYPGLGLKVVGLDDAVVELGRFGVIGLEDDGFAAMWVVNPQGIDRHRRDLMRCDAVEAAVLYRAARRWSALAATSLKNVRSASVSSLSMSRSRTPNRRQLKAPGRL
jgi:hypothetical protein